MRFHPIGNPSTLKKAFVSSMEEARSEPLIQSNLLWFQDGLLVMECLKDPLLAAYDCVILDEAHERTLHSDVLLGT